MKWLLDNDDRNFNNDEVENTVARIIDKNELMSTSYLKLALSCIDLTTLNSIDNESVGVKFSSRVSAFEEHFPDLPNVAAICVYPTLIKSVKKILKDKNVTIASVAGGFPSSQTFLEVKVLEIEMAVAQGAKEIDIVLNLGNFLAADYSSVIVEIVTLKRACGAAHLKVILESGALSYSQIWKASMLAMQGGADFIKTSTGKQEPAATPEAAWIMCSAIKEFYNQRKRKVGFKAAGGIVDPIDALKYIAIVKSVLGDEWLNPQLFRIGASRLANNLLGSIKGEKVQYF